VGEVLPPASGARRFYPDGCSDREWDATAVTLATGHGLTSRPYGTAIRPHPDRSGSSRGPLLNGEIGFREPQVFGTRLGSPISPNNVLRRAIFPACDRLELPRATWLTFRRTYSSWSHEKGVPGKVVAQLMGHANVDTTLNVYTQVLDGSVRDAVEKIGCELFTIVHKPGKAVTVTD
jgi:integrase